MMLHTKYQGSRPCVSDKKFFSCFPLYKPMQNMWPQKRAHILTQRYSMNKLGRGPQDKATFQISRLYPLWFLTRRFLMFSSQKSIFSLCDLDMQWTRTV